MMDTMQLLLLFCGSVLLGGVIIYLLYLKRRPDAHFTDQEEKKQQQQNHQLVVHTTPCTINSASKKQAKIKKRRETQQEFTHSWIVGAFKGHTGAVLDLSFSANGKILASCAEEAADKCSSSKAKKVVQYLQPPPSPSGSSKSSSSSSSEQKPQRAILSRRQRKNRTRAPRQDHDDDRPPPLPASTSPPSTRKQGKHRTKDQQKKGKQTTMDFKGSKTLLNIHVGPPRPRRPRHDLSITPSVPLISGTTALIDCSANSYSSIQYRNPFLVNQVTNYTVTQYSGDTSLSMTSVLPSLSISSENTSQTMSSESPSLIMSSESLKPAEYAHVSNATITKKLRNYLLSSEEMAELGYPLESQQHPGCVTIIQRPRPYHSRHNSQPEKKTETYRLDVNAQEFVPATYSGIVEVDSGRGSSAGSSVETSDCDQDSSSDTDNTLPKYTRFEEVERHCARCSKSFYMTREGSDYIYKDECCYHWGKLRRTGWECCKQRESSRGCTNAPDHVWTGIVLGLNGPYSDFMRTMPVEYKTESADYGVYSLDCEMCFTKCGLEIGRVTLVNLDGHIIFDQVVQPDNEIIDYNTRFSGLRSSDFHEAMSLAEVHNELKKFIYAETILIGHGLENDLRALKIVHPSVIDTAVCFPHYRGLPYKNSLKNLAMEHLQKVIQSDTHDSADDARIALQLMYCKLKLHSV